MVQLRNVEGAMRTASITRVAALIEDRPEESVAMLRNWLAETH
jgi:flagellar biosynthesis/type III secretory pathway M-ring protein FliF/YscJ